eukprot:2507013-Amphidinium_carterae.1
MALAPSSFEHSSNPLKCNRGCFSEGSLQMRVEFEKQTCMTIDGIACYAARMRPVEVAHASCCPTGSRAALLP